MLLRDGVAALTKAADQSSSVETWCSGAGSTYSVSGYPDQCLNSGPLDASIFEFSAVLANLRHHGYDILRRYPRP